MEQFKNENKENQERHISRIELSFFRHGEKEKDDLKPDPDVVLTEVGRKQAVEKVK